MEIISEMISGIWGAIMQIAKAMGPGIKLMVSLTLWVLSALFILPCVFVANTLYPKWEEWGGNL